jgi:Sec-independent protein secretion pathway component TatC
MRFNCAKSNSKDKNQEFFVVMVLLKFLSFSKPAGLTVFIYFSLFVPLSCSSGIFEQVPVLMRIKCRIGAQPRCLFDRRSVSIFVALGILEPQTAHH